MTKLAGCDGASPMCPGVHEDGDPETVVVVGAFLRWQELAKLANKIGIGETAVRVPRSVIVEAARKLGETETRNEIRDHDFCFESDSEVRSG